MTFGCAAIKRAVPSPLELNISNGAEWFRFSSRGMYEIPQNLNTNTCRLTLWLAYTPAVSQPSFLTIYKKSTFLYSLSLSLSISSKVIASLPPSC